MEFLLVLQYLLSLALLTVLGAPIAALVFQSLPSRGASFALPTALIPFAITIFWIGQITFGRHTVLLGVVALAASAGLAFQLGGAPDWRAVATGFGVFTVGFCILLVFRAANPGITAAGGEQFLHYGLVNALARAPSLPPEDFWYAGEPMRYYYGTQLQVVSLSMLSGIELRYGYNLGLAAFYGVLFVVAYGLVGAIVDARGYSYHRGGTLGAFFVALGGPTTTPIRLVTPHLPDSLSAAVAPAAFGFVADRFNEGDLATTVADLADPFDWSWWYTRYVVPGTLQEVPLYSFVKADLHGHALSTGYVLFAAAIGYAYYVTPADAHRRRTALLFGGVGSIAGVFGFMNTWSLPTAAGLVFLAVGAAEHHPASMLPGTLGARLDPENEGVERRLSRLRAELSRMLLAAGAAAVVFGIGVAIASPFLIFGRVPQNEGVGFLPPQSPLGPFLVIYSGLLAVFTVYVGTRGWNAMEARNRRADAVAVAGGLLAFIATAVVLDFPVLGVVGPLLLGAWLLVRSDHGDFALVLFVAGVGLLLSLELVHAKIPRIEQPRWNTALKVAVQGWTLGAAGAGAAAAILLSHGRDRIASHLAASTPRSDTDARESRPTFPTMICVVFVGLVLVATLVFPVMMVGAEVGSDIDEGSFDPTLDGHTSLEEWHPDESEAIYWLDDRQGTPTIVESTGNPYTFTSQASTYTGLPSVVGWTHEELYRGEAAYARRADHVDEIYRGQWADASAHLERYDVQYIYVGPNERERYGSELRSFDRPALSVAFENDAVTIYHVNQSAL